MAAAAAADDVFYVERIEGSRKRGTELLIKWHGYSEEHNSWEPRAGLMADAESGVTKLILQYERQRREGAATPAGGASNKKAARAPAGGARAPALATPDAREGAIPSVAELLDQVWDPAELTSLLDLVARDGPGDWQAKALALGTARTGAALEQRYAAWRQANGEVPQSDGALSEEDEVDRFVAHIHSPVEEHEREEDDELALLAQKKKRKKRPKKRPRQRQRQRRDGRGCEECGKPHDGTYGSGRFCSVPCKNRFTAARRIFASTSQTKDRGSSSPRQRRQAPAAATRPPEAVASGMGAQAECSSLTEEEAAFLSLQGGTGKHIDCNPAEPALERPFQAQVVLADQRADDGSLAVIPAFHQVARAYFEAKASDTGA